MTHTWRHFILMRFGLEEDERQLSQDGAQGNATESEGSLDLSERRCMRKSGRCSLETAGSSTALRLCGPDFRIIESDSPDATESED